MKILLLVFVYYNRKLQKGLMKIPMVNRLEMLPNAKITDKSDGVQLFQRVLKTEMLPLGFHP